MMHRRRFARADGRRGGRALMPLARRNAYYQGPPSDHFDGVRFFKVDPAKLINEFPDRLYGNGKMDDEMHNLAFLLCSRQMAADYEAHTGRRSYGISVAGWAAQQRFAGTWAVDTGGGPQPLVGILQDAIVGHTYATCDM